MALQTDPKVVARLAAEKEDENCAVCPIVYNVFEELKQELWNRSDSDWVCELDEI